MISCILVKNSLCVNKEEIDEENSVKQTIEKLNVNVSYLSWYENQDIEEGINWYCYHVYSFV